MSCPWRYLTADGAVLSCDGYGLQHGDDYESSCEHHYSPPGYRMVTIRTVGWGEDDPLAWDATCPTCRGEGIGDPSGSNDWVNCPECAGLGAVDTVPTHLVGPGSWLAHSTHGEAMVMYAFHESDEPFWTIMFADMPPGGSDDIPMDAPGWTLVRAVPPAADRN